MPPPGLHLAAECYYTPVIKKAVRKRAQTAPSVTDGDSGWNSCRFSQHFESCRG
ncbi:hypothetical protein JZ751_028336 [Albula glossodonta]|uniref:Uncharacterized protein n=1 Tax=Albula glossodonta TaxID=121402 RepID=A0A8T2NCX8_9TELE|nr:hypothetical protein JZ751_028336 [Albula glossodonta]